MTICNASTLLFLHNALNDRQVQLKYTRSLLCLHSSIFWTVLYLILVLLFGFLAVIRQSFTSTFQEDRRSTLLLNRTIDLSYFFFSRFLFQIFTLVHLFKVLINSLSRSPVPFFFFFTRPFIFSCSRIWATDFDEVSSTGLLMLSKPMIGWLWFSIHGSLDISIERRSTLAQSIAPPNMLPIKIDFVVKIMKDCDFKPCYCVDLIHYFFELRSVPPFCLAGSGVGQK